MKMLPLLLISGSVVVGYNILNGTSSSRRMELEERGPGDTTS